MRRHGHLPVDYPQGISSVTWIGIFSFVGIISALQWLTVGGSQLAQLLMGGF